MGAPKGNHNAAGSHKGHKSTHKGTHHARKGGKNSYGDRAMGKALCIGIMRKLVK